MHKPIYIIKKIEIIGPSNGFNVFVRGSNCIKKETQVEPIAYENKKEAYKNCAKLIEDFKRACPYENVELADWHSSRDNYYIIYCIGGSELHHITFYVEELLLKEDE